NVVTAHWVGALDLAHDVFRARALEEERNNLVGVVTGVPLVSRQGRRVTGHDVPLAVFWLIHAGEVAGFVVSGNNQQGFFPVGVGLDPLDGSVNGSVEVLHFFNLTRGLVRVTSPVNGAAFNHDGEAIVVLTQDIQRAGGGRSSDMNVMDSTS